MDDTQEQCKHLEEVMMGSAIQAEKGHTCTCM